MQHKLWYQQSAANWNEALPLGNGRIGAMVYHRVADEIICLNEDTLWSGYPKDGNWPTAHQYLDKSREQLRQGELAAAQELIESRMLGPYTQSYLPFGNLRLRFSGLEGFCNYRRELDLRTGISQLTFEVQDCQYWRELFVSAPEQCLVLRLSAQQRSRINFQATFSCLLQHQLSQGAQTLHIQGLAPSHVEPNYRDSPNPVVYLGEQDKRGMRFGGSAQFVLEGGSLRLENGSVYVQDADSVVILLALRTGFAGFERQPYTEGKPITAMLQADLERCRAYSYKELRQRHSKDFRSYFERVGFELGSGAGLAAAQLPTDLRLRRHTASLKAATDFVAEEDNGLYELLFQYGRYLLISSSRPGSQAANLQGIWNAELRPPWSSNYTININTQMNYWPAESCNLAEMHQPLFDLIERLRRTGARSARAYYSAPGFVSHHNTDLWAQSNPVGDAERGSAIFAYWNLSAAWLCGHLYQHFAYSQDQDFLAKCAWPALREAAEFLLSQLVEAPPDDAKDAEDNVVAALILPPATSPENAFLYQGRVCCVAQNATMSVAIAKELFGNAICCAEILGLSQTDTPIIGRLKDALPRLAPYQIGSQGQLLEWDREFAEVEPKHRHLSHLYALYPSYEWSRPASRPEGEKEQDELRRAAAQSLRLRGDEGTGWSLAWKINLWARLGDGAQALKLLQMQLRLCDSAEISVAGGGGSYANLFGAHPPFQIDSNFGTTAGIAELFLQGCGSDIFLLPALPAPWRGGHIWGLRSVGNLTWDIAFAEGRLTEAKVCSCAKGRQTFVLHYQQQRQGLELDGGESKSLYF